MIPHLDALAYLEKPPLQYWLTALTFRAFGQSKFTARLWTGLAGYGHAALHSRSIVAQGLPMQEIASYPNTVLVSRRP